MLSISDLLGWIGVIVSSCFFFSPALTFYRLIKKRIGYQDVHIIIILGNYISSIVWLIYGFKISLTQIIVCYSIGALISLVWIWIYLIHLGKKKMTFTLICALLLSVLTLGSYIVLAVIIDDKDTLGEVCFIVCSISYISPTQLLIKVLNKKDYKIIPIYSAAISAIGFGSWTLFGLFKFSATIIIPNLVGFAFSVAQIILYRVYKSKKPLDEEIGNISSTVIGAVKNVMERTVEIANTINPNVTTDMNATNGNIDNNNKNNGSNNPSENNNNISINFDTNNQNNGIDINNNINNGINFNTNLDKKSGDNNTNNAQDNNLNNIINNI